jgi:hypothetical protein
VVLVDHDVEADLVAQSELVEIAVEETVPTLGSKLLFGRTTRNEPRFSPSSQAGW